MTFFTITKLFREKEIAVNILFFSFLKLQVRVNILKVKKVKVHTSRGSSLPQKTLLVNSLPHKSETLWHHTTFPYHRFVCTCKKKNNNIQVVAFVPHGSFGCLGLWESMDCLHDVIIGALLTQYQYLLIISLLYLN